MFRRFSLGLICLLILFFPIFVFAATPSPIGVKCNNDSDCQSDKCEKSDLKISNNYYCTCNSPKDCADIYGQQTGENWTCKAGMTSTHDLHYCASDKRSPMYPLTNKEVIDVASGNDTPALITLDKPKIVIPIPEMPNFADIQVAPGQTANIPYLAQYIIALYRYGIVLGSILATVLLMIGGFLYLSSGGIQANASRGKEMIFGTITGLTLLLSAYFILKIVNPNLTQLNSLSLETIQGQEFDNSPITQGASAANAPVSPVGGTPAKVLPSPVGGTPSTTGNPAAKIVKGVPMAKGNGGAVIATLLGGPLPNTYEQCSPSALQYTANQLNSLNVCVGPCHCAYAVSNILEYIGCLTQYSGNAGAVNIALDAGGWDTMPITDSNQKSLPMGALLGSGHIGLSLGNGQQFQSGGWYAFSRVVANTGGTCKLHRSDTLGTTKCDQCAKIPAEAPTTGVNSNCDGNQGWTVNPIGDPRTKNNWGVITYPVEAGKTATPKSKCQGFYNAVISPALCTWLQTGYSHHQDKAQH